MSNGNLKIVKADADTIANYSFCGYKNIRNEGYRRKVEWLKDRFAEGLKFKLLWSPEEGSVGFIEYIPGEFSWRAVEARGFMMVHCVMLHVKKYKGKGYGSLLVEECLKDAGEAGMKGAAVVVSAGTWMAGRELFIKHGFVKVDEAPPSIELLALRFADVPAPRFRGDWEQRLVKYGPGLTIIRSDQCPFTAKAVNDICDSAEEMGMNTKVVELKNCIDAQNAPTAYGTFAIVHDGALIADHPISKRRFMNIMNKIT